MCEGLHDDGRNQNTSGLCLNLKCNAQGCAGSTLVARFRTLGLLFDLFNKVEHKPFLLTNLISVLIMEPLSVTLTVVSLATAVKDLVEFAQKVHNSFAKVRSITMCPLPVDPMHKVLTTTPRYQRIFGMPNM